VPYKLFLVTGSVLDGICGFTSSFGSFACGFSGAFGGILNSLGSFFYSTFSSLFGCFGSFFSRFGSLFGCFSRFFGSFYRFFLNSFFGCFISLRSTADNGNRAHQEQKDEKFFHGKIQV